MLRQIKMNEKGLSAIIGYVLLISFAMIIGGVVYYWMSSYLPGEEIKCPDGVSIFIEDFSCNYPDLELTIKNNGKFNIDGYYLRVAEDANEEVATKNLGDESLGGVIRFNQAKALEPGKEETKTFNLINPIFLIEIVPIRYEVVENKNKLATCSEAKISERINCG